MAVVVPVRGRRHNFKYTCFEFRNNWPANNNGTNSDFSEWLIHRHDEKWWNASFYTIIFFFIRARVCVLAVELGVHTHDQHDFDWKRWIFASRCRSFFFVCIYIYISSDSRASVLSVFNRSACIFLFASSTSSSEIIHTGWLVCFIFVFRLAICAASHERYETELTR